MTRQAARTIEQDAAPDDWAARLARLQTSYDVFKFLRETAEEFGFRKFSVVEVPWEETTLQATMIMNNWEPQFVVAYDALDLARNSPIYKHVRRSASPLMFDVQKVQSDAPTQQRSEAMEAFDSFRMTKGVIFPVFAASGMRGAITFTAPELSIDQAGIDRLHSRSIAIFEKVVSIVSEGRLRRPDLTEQDTQCLQMVAQGLSSAEIARTLATSVHSVNHSIALICKKLDAPNRVRAVATAIRLGLIS